MESSSDKGLTIVTCLTASLLLHAALFGGYGVYVTFYKPEPLPKLQKVIKKTPTSADETIVVQFSPTVSVLDKVPVIPKSMKDIPPDLIDELSQQEIEELEQKIEENKPNTVVMLPSQFERTTAAQQTTEPVPETRLFGERDTTAMSDTRPDFNAPERPSVSGVVDSTRAEVIDSKFRDGEVIDEGGGDSKPSGGEQGELDAMDSAEQLLAKLNKINDAPSPEELAKSVEEQLNQDLGEGTPNDIEKPDLSETIEVGKVIEKNAVEESLKEREKKNQRQAEAAKATEQNLVDRIKSRRGDIDHSKDPFAKAAGLSSEVERNRIKGSVSKTGRTASRNVKSSELGKYEAIILRAVEKEWNREVTINGGLLQPGQITMSFTVNSKGNVLNITTVDKNAGNGYNVNIALNGIKSATIPAMPSKLKSLRKGHPIEVSITFNLRN